MEIVSVLKEYLGDELSVSLDEIDMDTELFSSGEVDSFAMVSLLSFIETKFNFKIGPTDVNLANFDTLQRMCDYIDKRAEG